MEKNSTLHMRQKINLNKTLLFHGCKQKQPSNNIASQKGTFSQVFHLQIHGLLIEITQFVNRCTSEK